MKSVQMLTVLFFSTLLLLAAGAHDRAEALLASHECSFCHFLHGGPGFDSLLIAENSELACLSCHTVSINDTAAAEVHNPLGLASNESGYITCRECHDAHDNQGGNQKMVGYALDAQNLSAIFTPPAIREETPATVSLTYNVVTFTDSTDFNIVDPGLFGPCEVCHDPHHNAGTDCTPCHSHSGSFAAPDCTAIGCHDGLGSGALSVGTGSSHSETLTGYTCEECHTGHGAGTIEIPNNTTVGIDYGSNGESGIALGSLVASGDTEAEICWNCHDELVTAVSEWGTNTHASTGSSPYNYGSVNPGTGIGWYADTTPGGEVGATWSSAQVDFSYKTGQIQSTHSVDGTATTPGLDPVDNIRCSYCHDVHDLNTLVSDNSSGKPYLRGTWMGNPYREDGAPFSIQTYASQGNFGEVPRGGIGATELGGYQIDQNNGSPTSGWTLTSSAGLCTICHGSDVDTMNEFSVDELGAPETPAQSWVGTNGHSNAVLGGTGSDAVNIFREDWRKPNDGYCPPGSGTDVDGNAGDNGDSYCAGYPNMANQQFTSGSSTWGGSFRGAASLGAQGFWVEPQIGGNQPFAYDDYNWGATVDVASTDSQYHQFSCSKCHNPHASRLQRLMTTNCLDFTHNTWGDSPVTMSKEDLSRPVTITSDCGQGGTFNIEFIDIANDLLYLPQSAFSASCTRADYTITWDETDYSYARSDLVSNVTINIRGTDYTFDSAEVSAVNVQSWIGKGVLSKFSMNDADKSRISDDNSGVKITYATSAQNCHRYVDWNDNNDTSDPGDQRGWNNVTPW